MTIRVAASDADGTGENEGCLANDGGVALAGAPPFRPGCGSLRCTGVRLAEIRFSSGTGLAHRHRRKRVDVGDDIDHHRPIGFKRLFERGREFRGLLHAQAERADILGYAREVDLRVGP